jgi:hypothetical protein
MAQATRQTKSDEQHRQVHELANADDYRINDEATNSTLFIL